jgi:hypothetical protein
MFESAKEGFLGLFLVLGQWLSPGGDDASLRAAAQFSGDTLCVIQCALQTSWSQELSDLVDAGIPLRFRLSAMSDAGDTIVFIRTLHCDIADFTYSFRDSSVTALPREPSALKKYPQILLALREYARWSISVRPAASACRIEAELLPSRAERLGRTVDMSQIWGQKKIGITITLK